MNYLSWTKIALGFAIDILLVWSLGNELKEHYQKAHVNEQRTAAPEPAVENTDE